MAKHIWEFDINGIRHEVILKFDLISGRQIWLDGKLINKGRNTFESGSEYHFFVDEHPAELGIVSTPIGYEFYLRINNKFVYSKTNKKIGKSTLKKFEQHQKLIDFANKHGLKYLPSSVHSSPSLNQRFIGYIKNFLVIIAFGYRNAGGNSIPGFYILIRHETIDAERAKEIKNDEEVKLALRNLKIPAELLQIDSTFSHLFVNSGFWKANEFQTIEKLLSIFNILANKLRPSAFNKCEGPECNSPYYKELTLTLINGVPQNLCQECIDHINTIGKKIEEDYKKQPHNLLAGTLYGLAAALLGAIFWALVFIFLERIGAVFAVFIFFLVVKAMDYAKTKRTFISLFVASLLSLFSSITGTYFGMVGYLYKEGELEITISELIELAQWLLNNPEVLNDTIFFALIGLVPYLFITWNSNRTGLKKYFKPDVELIRNFELRDR